MTVPYEDPTRGYWGRVFIAADRLANAIVGGLDDQTISQTLGFLLLRRNWLGILFAPIVDLGNRVLTGERRHCLNSVYGRDGRPIWPSRLPDDAPATAAGLSAWRVLK